MSEPIRVNVKNFIRAETDRTFASMAAKAGTNHWQHLRVPTPLEDQRVIRMNRDTLYSSAVVDLSNGATLTIPDADGRYLSVMVVNQDHYINRVFHDAGEYALTTDEFDTAWVLVGARILVDPEDAADVAAVNALQDRLGLTVASSAAFEPPDYDRESLDATRNALLELAHGLTEFTGAFGARTDVDPVLHLLGTAAGWGGLPESEAIYLGVEPRLPVGDYVLRVGDVPVDAFWSISVYNAQGYFEPNDRDVTSVNSVSAARDPDGGVTVHFGTGDAPNTIPIMPGWNYTVRLYRPRAEIVDGSWKFPGIEP